MAARGAPMKKNLHQFETCTSQAERQSAA